MESYAYRLVTVSAVANVDDVAYEFAGQKIVYSGPTSGPDITIKLDSVSGDAIPLTPRSSITIPSGFNRFYVGIPAASAVNPILFVSSPAELSYLPEELVVADISNVERVDHGTSGSVAMSAVAATVRPINTTRKKMHLQNTGVNPVYIKPGSGAAITDFKMLPDQEICLENYTGLVSGICDAGQTSTVRYLCEG